MGQLYDHNGRGIKNIPLLSFENGEVTRYGQSIKDIKMRYNNNYIYMYPRTSFDAPVASFQEDKGIWYIYNYPKRTFDTSIGYLENGKIYKSSSNIIREPIGYYEGYDMPGACAAAYYAFFSSNSNSTSVNSKTETSTIKISDSSTRNNTTSTNSNDGGGGGSPITTVIGFLLSPILIYFIWHSIKYMVYLYSLIILIYTLVTIFSTIFEDGKKFHFLGFLGGIVLAPIIGIAYFGCSTFILLLLNIWRYLIYNDYNQWSDTILLPHQIICFFLVMITTVVLCSYKKNKK